VSVGARGTGGSQWHPVEPARSAVEAPLILEPAVLGCDTPHPRPVGNQGRWCAPPSTCDSLIISICCALKYSASCPPSNTAHPAINPATAPTPPLPRTAGRRLLAGGGGGWNGGVNTQSILSENDAKAGIVSAVSSDQYSATYHATSAGYRDAYASTFPDDDAGETDWPCLLG
jgi:hypothetical protein